MAKQQADRRFVGSTFKIADNFFSVGFTKEHLELLLAELAGIEGDFVNINVGTSKDGAKAFAWVSDFKKKGGGNVVTSNQSGGDEMPF